MAQFGLFRLQNEIDIKNFAIDSDTGTVSDNSWHFFLIVVDIDVGNTILSDMASITLSDYRITSISKRWSNHLNFLIY